MGIGFNQILMKTYAFINIQIYNKNFNFLADAKMHIKLARLTYKYYKTNPKIMF